MAKHFLVCIPPSEVHTFHIIDRLKTAGISNARIRAFVEFLPPSSNGLNDSRTLPSNECPSGLTQSPFSQLGFPDCEAKHYGDRIRSGRIVICVQSEAPEEMTEVLDILEDASAEEISSVPQLQTFC